MIHELIYSLIVSYEFRDIIYSAHRYLLINPIHPLTHRQYKSNSKHGHKFVFEQNHHVGCIDIILSIETNIVLKRTYA